MYLDGPKGDPAPAPTTSEINGAMFDRFSWAHMAFGGVCGYLGVSWHSMVGLAWGWEVAEDGLKARWPHLFPHASPDTKRNALGDVVVAVLGYILVLPDEEK